MSPKGLYSYTSVLVSAGIVVFQKWFFVFLVGRKMLVWGFWMGFGMRRVLIIYRCFQLLVRKQGILNLPCLANVQVPQKLGGHRARATDPNWPMEYSISFTDMFSTQMRCDWEAGCSPSSRSAVWEFSPSGSLAGNALGLGGERCKFYF